MCKVSCTKSSSLRPAPCALRQTLCLYVGYTASVYCTASVLTLAAIALDRYCSIVDCLRYGARCTLWRSCSVVLWIWLQALLTSLPPLLGWSSVEYVAPMYRYSLVVRAGGIEGGEMWQCLPRAPIRGRTPQKAWIKN